MTVEDTDHSRPAPAEGHSLEEIGEFLLLLVQAFFRSGYYQPDHPEALRSKEGLFEKMQSLAAASGEMTVLVRGDEAASEIYIEGLSDKPLRLRDTMMKGMAATYNPRFVRFLERKELISLSLSTRMDAAEFGRFIDLMSDPFLEDMRERAIKERFVSSLRDRDIQHISFVFNEDFITERRQLPWRAAMALSRLKKDLTLIPVFKNLETRELGDVRREILADIMRPLNVPELVYAFLMNLDLVRTRDLSEEEAEDHILTLIHQNVLLRIAPIFIKDAAGTEVVFRDLVSTDKFSRILGKICTRLNEINETEAKRLIEEMFQSGLLSLEELSPELRDRIQTVQTAMSFLDKQADYLKHLDKLTDPGDYSHRSHSLAKIVPVLIERGRHAEATSIVARISAHQREQSPRSPIARETLAWIAKGEALDLVHQAFLSGGKEERVALGEFLTLLGEWSAPHLLAIINGTDDPWKKKHAAEILARIGPGAAASLIYEVERGSADPETVATILKVLGQVSESDEQLRLAAGQVMKEKAGADDPEIRREALQGLVRLDVPDSFDLYAGAAGDSDFRTRKAAIRGLGMSQDTRAFAILRDLVNSSERPGGKETGEAGAAALEALGHLHEGCRAAREEIVAFLQPLSERAIPAGGLKRLFGRAHEFPPFLCSALADTLGRVGDAWAREALEVMAERGDEHLARKASEILRRLEQSER